MNDEGKYVLSIPPYSPVVKVINFLNNFVVDNSPDETRQSLQRYAQYYSNVLEDYIKNIEAALADKNLPWGTLSNLYLMDGQSVVFDENYKVDPDEKAARVWLAGWADLIREVLATRNTPSDHQGKTNN